MRNIHRQFMSSSFYCMSRGLVLMAMLAVAMPGIAVGQEKYVVRLGHDTIDDYQDALAEYFADEAKRLSGGRVDVQVYPANQLGSNESMNQQVRTGALQAMIQPTAFLTPVAPELSVLDLPFLFPSHEVQNKVLNTDAAKPLNDALRKEGYVATAWVTGGFKQFNTSFPLREASDLEGRTYRTMTSEILVDTFEHWGSTVSTMSFSEVYTAIEQGTVEGHENPPDATYHMKLHEPAPYYTISDHGALTTVLTLSEVWYDDLPKDIQRILQEASAATTEHAHEVLTSFHEEALAAMKDDGVEIIRLPEEEREKLRAKAEPVWEKVRSDETLGPVLERLEAEIAKY